MTRIRPFRHADDYVVVLVKNTAVAYSTRKDWVYLGGLKVGYMLLQRLFH